MQCMRNLGGSQIVLWTVLFALIGSWLGHESRLLLPAATFAATSAHTMSLVLLLAFSLFRVMYMDSQAFSCCLERFACSTLASLHFSRCSFSSTRFTSALLSLCCLTSALCFFRRVVSQSSTIASRPFG